MSKPLKVVILGSGGRVGAALARGYAKEGSESGELEVVAFNRSQLDLACNDALERTLGELSFDALVNCAASTSPDYCETHPEEAFAVNARGVGKIAEICSRKGARCIHLSTDYVFDGREPGMRTESDATGAINVYGASKLAGEEALLAVSEEHLAVRVSWVFGPDRAGFLEQTLRKAVAGEDLEAIADKWSKPTSVFDIQAELRPFLREIRAGGVLHLTQSGGPVSWHEYAQQALDFAMEAGIDLKTRQVRPMSMAQINFAAPRPVHTAMATDRLEALTGRAPRPWQEALEEYVRSRQWVG